MKVTKKGIKKAIIFYYDEDKELPRMVLFGQLDTLLPFYIEMMDAGLRRLQDIIEEAGGKENMSKEEILEVLHGTRPPWMRDNYTTANKEAVMSLTYKLKEIK